MRGGGVERGGAFEWGIDEIPSVWVSHERTAVLRGACCARRGTWRMAVAVVVRVLDLAYLG